LWELVMNMTRIAIRQFDPMLIGYEASNKQPRLMKQPSPIRTFRPVIVTSGAMVHAETSIPSDRKRRHLTGLGTSREPGIFE